MLPEDEVFCPECGYNLFGIPERRCPECGFGYDRTAIRKLADIYMVAKLDVYQHVTRYSLAAIGLTVLPCVRLVSSVSLWLMVLPLLLVGLFSAVWQRASVWITLSWAAAIVLWFYPEVAPLPSCGLVGLSIYRLLRLRQAPSFVALSVSPERQQQLRRSGTFAFISLGASILVLTLRLT